ncbi:alpha-keto acid decarboxylase family protein [Aspergillus clavatus NRRL 1]|uniref:Pyruvate decarboxylase n=1 Tax=Aspergillus clavatus (strain ATCC 1007 / CBS 513.65 / DSM 816 / NCTC 3887 / NRRL 1 / QM 1276 / 107) TaxID=344612 RepID=A1CN38_ASPCL|nr:pyruvate decarboxylase, putative [Aspergillus clavatus NRRL 1]EAW08975.1 pyruvate decarboxylase, putative [Aspergillus clavatus NRRL 1]
MEGNTLPLAQYLFTRLRQLGVDSLFGVPGDYNLTLLDHVVPSGLKWVGNCNELNAGYAADGYSRIKGIGALVTTFGVGELSAVNAIAGAYAERAPVVHIVGTPMRASQETRSLIHHTFNDGEYQRFDRMQEHVTVAQVALSDHRTAPAEIDRVLLQCLLHSRPVRITIPVDMVSVCVPSVGLTSKIEIPPPVRQPLVEEAALTCVVNRIYGAKKPMILVDGESRAFGTLAQVDQFIKTTGWPTFTTGFGKGLVDETLPNVYGVYTPASKEFVDSCDLVLSFGPHFSNTNTYIFLVRPNDESSILLNPTSVQVNKDIFRDLPVKYFIHQLIQRLDRSKIPSHQHDLVHPSAKSLPAVTPTDLVTQTGGFWRRLSPFFRPGDIVLGETGTPGYGANDFVLPPRTRLFKPVTWLSIGYMLPATLGASHAQWDLIARCEYHDLLAARTILFIGDGSFQMTAQELSTIIHQKLNVIVFLINNDGYTIERCIHGRNQAYNDVARWRYLKAPELFGADTEGEYATRTWEIRTWADFDRVLSDEHLVNGKGLRMVEVFMDRFDAPDVLMKLLEQQVEREKTQ